MRTDTRHCRHHGGGDQRRGGGGHGTDNRTHGGAGGGTRGLAFGRGLGARISVHVSAEWMGRILARRIHIEHLGLAELLLSQRVDDHLAALLGRDSCRDDACHHMPPGKSEFVFAKKKAPQRGAFNRCRLRGEGRGEGSGTEQPSV